MIYTADVPNLSLIIYMSKTVQQSKNPEGDNAPLSVILKQEGLNAEIPSAA